MRHASSPQCRRAGTTRSPAFSSGGARDELAGVVLRLAADAALLVAELAAEEVRRVEPLRQLVAAVLLRERVAVHAAVLRAEGDQRVAFRPVGGVGREEWGDLSRTGDMRSEAASQDRDGWHTHRLHRRGCACAVLRLAVAGAQRQRLCSASGVAQATAGDRHRRGRRVCDWLLGRWLGGWRDREAGRLRERESEHRPPHLIKASARRTASNGTSD